ncbi:MAG: 30S ribosome-binding factor RbfA [Thermodesulfovibrionales bacterium]|jgi:ribosome-binding factor A|nr:30S ribosome-binding factor RbfA [Thermodesulfovibrionales bacterium]
MLPYKRSQRVSDLLREEIADIIMYKLKDPRIGFITVTGVDVTSDLKMATVYVSVLKEEEKKPTLEILQTAKSFVRSELSKRLRMKFIPTVDFKLDSSIEYGDKIDKLLKEIGEKDDSSS